MAADTPRVRYWRIQNFLSKHCFLFPSAALRFDKLSCHLQIILHQEVSSRKANYDHMISICKPTTTHHEDNLSSDDGEERGVPHPLDEVHGGLIEQGHGGGGPAPFSCHSVTFQHSFQLTKKYFPLAGRCVCSLNLIPSSQKWK